MRSPSQEREDVRNRVVGICCKIALIILLVPIDGLFLLLSVLYFVQGTAGQALFLLALGVLMHWLSCGWQWVPWTKKDTHRRKETPC